MKNKTRQELVAEISDDTGISRQTVKIVFDQLLECLTKAMAAGVTAEIRGFGVFEMRVAKARIGRNLIAGGTPVEIPERAVVKFRPGVELKKKMQERLA